MPAAPFLPIRHPVVEAGPVALMTDPWMAWARGLHTIVTELNLIPGINLKTLAQLNALGLGAADVGYLAWETAYGHSLRWTGSVWSFAPGDCGNGQFSFRAIAPQEVGWQVCDGTVTDYLTVGGATLTVTPFTTPNLVGSPAYLKSIAAYTGTIEAASGATGSSTAGVSGATGSEAAHTHTTPNHQHGISGIGNVDLGTTTTLPGSSTQVDGSGVTGAGSAHSHDAGTLEADLHNHSPNTLELRRLGGLVYFRR